MPEKKINIEPEKFREFEAENLEPEQKNGGAADGSRPDTGNGFANPIEARKVEVLEKIATTADWLLDTAQKQAEKNDLPGIGDEEFREDYRELGMIVLEDWADSIDDIEFLKDSPKYMFMLLSAGVAMQNAIPLINKIKGSEKKEDSKE